MTRTHAVTLAFKLFVSSSAFANPARTECSGDCVVELKTVSTPESYSLSPYSAKVNNDWIAWLEGRPLPSPSKVQPMDVTLHRMRVSDGRHESLVTEHRITRLFPFSLARNGTTYISRRNALEGFDPEGAQLDIEMTAPWPLQLHESTALSLNRNSSIHYELSPFEVIARRYPDGAPSLHDWRNCQLIPGGVKCTKLYYIERRLDRAARLIWDPGEGTVYEFEHPGREDTLRVFGVYNGWAFIRYLHRGVSLPGWFDTISSVLLIHLETGTTIELPVPGSVFQFSPHGIIYRLGPRMRLWDPVSNRVWDFAPLTDLSFYGPTRHTQYYVTNAPKPGVARIWIWDNHMGSWRLRFFDTSQNMVLLAPWREECKPNKAHWTIHGACLYSPDKETGSMLLEELVNRNIGIDRRKLYHALSTRYDVHVAPCLLDLQARMREWQSFAVLLTIRGEEEAITFIDEVEQTVPWRDREAVTRTWLKKARSLIEMRADFIDVLGQIQSAPESLHIHPPWCR